jgi:hypothetical protein
MRGDTADGPLAEAIAGVPRPSTRVTIAQPMIAVKRFVALDAGAVAFDELVWQERYETDAIRPQRPLP